MKAEDEVRFTEFVAPRRLRLRQLAYIVVSDWQAADDAVQDGLVRLYRTWHKAAIHEHPDAYVRRIVLNEALRRVRRRKMREEPSGQVPELDPQDPYPCVDLQDALWNALTLLPARQRAAIALRYLDDLSEIDAAFAMGCPVGTIKSHTSRGLATLRRQVLASELF